MGFMYPISLLLTHDFLTTAAPKLILLIDGVRIAMIAVMKMST